MIRRVWYANGTCRAQCAAADGRPLDLGQPCPGLLADADCVFVEVPEDRYDDWVLSACWYYRGSDFPLYQLVWPSVDGPYPWQRDADERLRALQPVLGEPPIERGATGARSASDFRIGSWLKAGAQ